MKKFMLNHFIKISLSIILLIMILSLTIFIVLLNTDSAKADVVLEDKFVFEEMTFDGGQIIRCKNLDKFEMSSDVIGKDVSYLEENIKVTNRELSLLHKIGFNDNEISDMSDDIIDLYTTTDFIERRITEYIIEEESSDGMMPLISGDEKYKKLIVTNTLVSNGFVNGNNRYIASIKVNWTAKPANQLTDYMYIACGNGSSVYSSQYRECYLSYTNRIVVPQIGYITDTIKYTNGDGSGKIVEYNNNYNGEGWKINVPFMPSYNQFYYDIEFFMQSELTVPQNVTAGVYYAYLHQKLVGSPGFSISASGPSVSFNPYYTMDLFSGPHFAIENGEIV